MPCLTGVLLIFGSAKYCETTVGVRTELRHWGPSLSSGSWSLWQNSRQKTEHYCSVVARLVWVMGSKSNGGLWNTRWQQTYQVNFHCSRSSEHVHITKNNGYYLVSLLPPSVPKVSHLVHRGLSGRYGAIFAEVQSWGNLCWAAQCILLRVLGEIC